VTLFEASQRIGGLWPIDKVDDEGLINPEMCVNQSRHTVSFSDLAWGEKEASFPQAWEVGRYLERYVETYGVEVKLGNRVVGTVREGQAWRVRVKEGEVEKVFTVSFCVAG
jgi:cation diffusion facilitator CzcD-associated flavoprotein CzcO